MFSSPFACLVVQPLDVVLELLTVDPPHTATPDLDGRQLARAHQRVDLRDAHAEIGGDIFEREQARLDAGRAPTSFGSLMRIGHAPHPNNRDPGFHQFVCVYISLICPILE